MTDGGNAFQPGHEEISVPVRPRSAFVAHEAFGHGDGAVLVEPEIARDLRNAAEFARQERRIAGGLLYGRPWTDDEGEYLVVDGFLEAGPGETPDDQLPGDEGAPFALSDADLRLLRDDADRMYSAAIEVGWWRSLPGPGEFGPRDFESQRELVPPGGVGLLVFGSGLDWGTAYLGPDAQVPGSARSFIPVPRPATEPPLPEPRAALAPVPPAPDPSLEFDSLPDDDDPAADDREPEPVGAAAPDGAGVMRRQPVLTPAPQPAGPPVISPVRVPTREWGGAKARNPGFVGPHMPADVMIVVILLAIVIVIAAIMVGVLTNNALVALILAVVGLLAGGAVIWASRA